MTSTNPLRSRLAVRIVLPFALSLVVVFGLIALYLGRAVQNEAKHELRERGTLLANTLANNAELALLARDTKALNALLESSGHDPDLLRAEIFDDAGTLLTSYAPPGRAEDWKSRLADARALELNSPIQTLGSGGAEHESSAFALDTPPDAVTRTIGSIRLHVSMDRTATRTRRLQLALAGAGVVLLVLCAAIGAGLVRVIGARLRALVEATRRVAAGDLSVRVEPSSQDEIGELGEAFNRMAADLEVTRADLLTERADLERRVALRGAELERAQETLVHNEKMSAVGQLVAGVAHELNNPLTGVLGYAGLLLLDKTIGGETRRKLELLSGEAERTRKIVQNLLTFARKQKPERGSVDANEVITRTVGLRAYQLRNENIQIETDLDAQLPRTWADFNQLQQVILNLVVNAEQAIQDAGKGSRVRLSTRRRGEGIEIEVEDDGPGIPPAARSRIFEPFFTTKPVGRGTGLGLSICYGIIVEHGGTVDVESEPGAFTRFRIGLPMARQSDAAQQAPSKEETAPTIAADSAPRHVLVIDDDPSVLRFVVDAFRGMPVTIETAPGGQEGMTRLSAGQMYDLILSDMRMPDVDGRAIFRYVREHRPELMDALVFTSGDIANPDSLHFLEQSGRPILEKPFSLKTLREIVIGGAGAAPVSRGQREAREYQEGHDATETSSLSPSGGTSRTR